jgi:HK97 family phage portal protein
MSILDPVKKFLTLDIQSRAELQERNLILAEPFDFYPDLPTQIANIRRYDRMFRTASIQDALGVPAIFGAVNLIANLVGSMSMKAMRNEVELPPDDRPRVIVRPDPFTIPREFYRSTAYNLATRGEAWWWIARRDFDGNPISVLNINPAEVQVEENPNDLRYPRITWRDTDIKIDDIRQLVYSREPGSLRGVGPLQMCGAAISVAVEAQQWASNFFASGNSALWVKTSIPLSGGDSEADAEGQAEVDRFLSQWMSKDSNTPRVTDDTIEDIKSLDINPQGAQMLESRAYQNVEVATMFNIDAELLNAAVTGSNLTYQNIGGRFDGLIRTCLRPNYLEVIEQTMSDLLPRSTVARFNTDFLTMADPKTRWEVYELASKVIGLEAATKMALEGEGLAPGDVENAPVPFSVPQAVPDAVQVLQRRSTELRCDGMRTFRRSGITKVGVCNALLSESGRFVGTCRKCKKVYEAA